MIQSLFFHRDPRKNQDHIEKGVVLFETLTHTHFSFQKVAFLRILRSRLATGLLGALLAVGAAASIARCAKSRSEEWRGWRMSL